MAQRAKPAPVDTVRPRSRTFGTAAVSARRQFAWLWSRESVLRLALSFVLATALWLYVTSREDPTLAWEFLTPLPVSTQGVGPKLIVTNSIPQIHVRIRANRNEIVPTASNFLAFVNLARFGPGAHTVRVHVQADPGIQVLRVTPARVPVVLDALTQRAVPVRAHISSRPSGGYIEGSIELDPSTVTVAGPSAILSQITQAAVFVDVAGARTSVTGAYRPTLIGGQNPILSPRSLSVDPPEVRVRVPIIPLSRYKTLPIVPTLQGQPQDGLGVVSLTVNPFETTINGRLTSVGGLSSVSTYPISLTNRKLGTFSHMAALRLPSGVRSTVTRVKVTVQIGPATQAQVIQVPVAAVSLPAGLAANTRPSTLVATMIAGPGSSQPASSRITASIDLTGLHVGRYTLRPRVQAPSGLRIASVYPAQVQVTVSRVKKR